MAKGKKILLSFDVEEFDIPLEYKQTIEKEEQLATGYKGLLEIKELLLLPELKTTLFTTAFFAEQFTGDIQELSLTNEIASHTYFHSSFTDEDLKKSKEKLESITGKTVTGLRMPRMKKIANEKVIEAGYVYNSSMNPTWIPGRYNNLKEPRGSINQNGLIQFPVSVTPHLRIPLFWLAFKNMPYGLFLKLALQTLRHDGYLSLYFHPWEFTDLAAYRLPGYVKRGSDKKLLIKLKRLIKDLSMEGEFITMDNFLNNTAIN